MATPAVPSQTGADVSSGAGSASRTGPRRDLLGNSVRLFAIGGVDVAVHVSWLVIFGLVTWSLAVAYFPAALPEASALEHWLFGGVAAFLLFLSVLLHELAHSFVAHARGIDVRSITLFIFGGISNLRGEAKQPGAEFQIAIVGPITSFAIAGLALLVAAATNAIPPIQAIATYLALINAVLGAFNLLPGFPLDGGRVLRSIVWSTTNDLRRATEVASGAGQVVAWGLMLWGFWRVLGGDVFGGIWMVAIGWFLQNAAVASLQQTLMERHLRRMKVRDVIRPDTTGVAPSTSIQALIDRYVLPGARRAVPVVEEDAPVGIVTLADIRSVQPEERDSTIVRDIMSGGDRLITVAAATSLQKAMDVLADSEHEQVPVVEDGRLVGVLTRADVLRQLQIREALELDRGTASASGWTPARRY
jgi:Zn-dependent protease/CBS domain-containing protein